MIIRLRYLQVALLVAVVGCASRTPETPKPAGRPVTYQGGQVTLSGRLSATEYASGEDIKMTAIVKNSGSTPVFLEEGGFMAVFIVGGEAKTFLQSARASYASGVKTVTVNPDEVYEEMFTIHPKDWGEQRKLAPGQYRVRISYQRRDSYRRPEVDRGANRLDQGIVRSLDSEEIFVRIK